MSWNKNTHCLPLILSVALGTLPAFAETPKEDDVGPVRLVSGELFDALEGWSEFPASLEMTALDTYPEAVIGYSREVESAYGGLTLSEHFARSYPETVEAYREQIEGEIEDEADFLAYVIESSGQVYEKWQKEDVLAGRTFAEFVERNHPSVVADLERIETPADRGMTIADHVREIGREDLLDELYSVLDTVGGGSTRCECWTIATFPRNPDSYPGPWEHEIEEEIRESSGLFGSKKKELDFDVWGEGAAKDIDFYRKTKRTLWELERTKSTNYTHFRVRMHCTESGVPGGRHCEGSTCTGELAMRAEYASRVFQKVDVGGIWSKRARVLTSDLAELSYDPPGPAAEMMLFQKGVAVSGDVKTGWSSEAALQIITGAAGIAAIVAGDGTSIGDLLEGDLITNTVNGIIGLITREGEESEHSQDMYVAFDTAGTAPLPLLPNTSHLFRLDTMSHIYNRGYGKESKGWANVDSSHFITAVARNYQCATDVTAPTPQAFWFYDGAGTPHTNNTLRNLVGNFVATEMGIYPSGLNNREGQYP
ncbi:MAG: hypothetical protein AAF657_14080 [Acidobacteriota bacterium]